jgi:ADP-dependent NAD(P)H-hydrate dehydratase / NAD(P)H-hydrate epimerase
MDDALSLRFFRAAGMRAADAAAAGAGIDSYELMRAAGRAVARALLERWPEARRVSVLCGPGNNGGDGYVAADALAAAGAHVTVFELRSDPGGDDARRARADLLAAGHARVRMAPEGAAPPGDADVVIDALFGSGLSRALEGRAAEWVRALEDSGHAVLAVDVPSGVRADLAGIVGPVVRARATVQLAGAVAASALAPARATFGDALVVDIGIPAHILDAHAAGVLVSADLVPDHIADLFEPPADDLHKYRAGTVLVVGGSARYAGAAELAARGAYRAGAGLVTILGEARAPSGWPEVIWEPLAHAGDAAERIGALGARRSGAVVLGPGWDAPAPALLAALEAAEGSVVLDAGALQHELAGLARERGDVVLTPHHGEAQRLLRAAGSDVDADVDPLAAAVELARAWGAIVVLKGAGTVIADAHGRVALCRTGSPAMATGGTGDVLAGVIGALVAPAEDAGDSAARRFTRVVAGTLLHGVAGEIAAERGVGMVASDLAEALPEARRRLART